MKIRLYHTTVLVVLLGIVTTPTGFGQVPESLKKIEDQYVAAFQLHVENGHQSKVAELNARYITALEKALQAAAKGDRLEEALALKEEMKRVQEKEPLPERDEGTQPVLLKFRKTYREQLAKLMVERENAAKPIVKKFDEALGAHQSELTKTGKIEDAAAVKAYREAGVTAKLLGEGTVPPELAERSGKLASGRRDPVLAAATKEKPFENSLGMKFVPVKGTDVLFCIHETRWKDYAEYAKATPGVSTSWQRRAYQSVPPDDRQDEHPVVWVTWDDATAFCKWLSEREKRIYRLPADREWSIAVGLGRKEKWEKDDTPETLNLKRDRKEFPWGREWPIPRGAGNYCDLSYYNTVAHTDHLEGYDDGYPSTAPVMRFKPNEFGLYDLGGNVWEWVEDWWNTAKTDHVLRGGSFNYTTGGLPSGVRMHRPPDQRGAESGFRLVLEGSDVH